VSLSSTAPPPRPKPVSYAHAAGGTSQRSSQPTVAPKKNVKHVPVQAQRGRGRGRSATGGRGRGHHHHPAPPPEPLAIPTEEFDFQQQLEKFDKDKIVEEVKAQLEGKTVYQKDDFFDSLSCDALEQSNGTDRHQRMARQRRTDVATFGSAARQGGGRGRGTRGRGHPSSSTGGRGAGRQSQSQSQSHRERTTKQ